MDHRNVLRSILVFLLIPWFMRGINLLLKRLPHIILRVDSRIIVSRTRFWFPLRVSEGLQGGKLVILLVAFNSLIFTSAPTLNFHCILIMRNFDFCSVTPSLMLKGLMHFVADWLYGFISIIKILFRLYRIVFFNWNDIIPRHNIIFMTESKPIVSRMLLLRIFLWMILSEAIIIGVLLTDTWLPLIKVSLCCGNLLVFSGSLRAIINLIPHLSISYIDFP